MQRVRHANRGRLLLRTPGPVPLWDLQIIFCRDHWHSIIHYTTNSWPSSWFDSLPNSNPFLDDTTNWLHFTRFYFLLNLTSLNIGFHGAYATGVACWQGTLTPPETWSCPTLGLACVLMSRPISPELVLSPDLWISNTPRYFSFAHNWCKVWSVGSHYYWSSFRI